MDLGKANSLIANIHSNYHALIKNTIALFSVLSQPFPSPYRSPLYSIRIITGIIPIEPPQFPIESRANQSNQQQEQKQSTQEQKQPTQEQKQPTQEPKQPTLLIQNKQVKRSITEIDFHDSPS